MNYEQTAVCVNKLENQLFKVGDLLQARPGSNEDLIDALDTLCGVESKALLIVSEEYVRGSGALYEKRFNILQGDKLIVRTNKWLESNYEVISG